MIDDAVALPENKSIQVVARQTLSPADLSASAQLLNIKAAKPDVLLVLASGTPFGTILRSAHDAGLDVPVIAPSSNMHLDQLAQYTGFIPRVLLFGSSRGAVFEPQAEPKVARAQKAFFDAFRRAGIEVSNGHSVPWDATQILIDALQHLGPNATAAQLRGYVANLTTFTGIDGSYDFRTVPQRGIGADGAIMFQWNPAANAFEIASRPRGE